MQLKKIDEKMLVSGQIAPEDMAGIAETGVTMIVNNRPDGEEPGQPSSAEIEAAARAAGLDYRFVPVGSGGLSPDLVRAMGQALEASEGRVLAFCRSGTRSTYVWGLARAAAGDDGDEIMRKAEGAGYDLTPLRRFF